MFITSRYFLCVQRLDSDTLILQFSALECVNSYFVKTWNAPSALYKGLYGNLPETNSCKVIISAYNQ